MTAEKIKQLLHESIENIDDKSLLLEMKNFLESKYTPKKAPVLTKAQVKRITESKQQIKTGKSYKNTESNAIVDKWLNE